MTLLHKQKWWRHAGKGEWRGCAEWIYNRTSTLSHLQGVKLLMKRWIKWYEYPVWQSKLSLNELARVWAILQDAELSCLGNINSLPSVSRASWPIGDSAVSQPARPFRCCISRCIDARLEFAWDALWCTKQIEICHYNYPSHCFQLLHMRRDIKS